MPATIRTPRSEWLEVGLRALGAGGPDAVRVEVLAAQLGVTKGGFYGTFGTRAAFLDELLDEWERRSTDDVVAQVEARGGPAADRIARAGFLTFGRALLPVDLAVRAWARRDGSVAARLRRVDDKRMAYLRAQFGTFVDDPDEVEGRATLAFCLVIGQHFLAAGHDGRSRRQAVELAGRILLGS